MKTTTIQQSLDSALLHHTAGDLSKAESIYRQILQTESNHPVALHLLGVIAHQTGKNNIALDLITKALVIKPNYAAAYVNLGNALKNLGRPEEAIVNYEKALAIKPEFAEAHSNLGNVLRQIGQLEEAFASCHKALSIKPDFAEAHSNLGVALKEMGRLDEAVARYRKALEIKPDYVEAHYNLGLALHELGLLEEAIFSYNSAQSNHSRAKTLECLYALERYDDFYLSLDELLAVDKNNIAAAAISAFASQQLNRSDPHPFCKQPMDFVRVYDALDGPNNSDGLLHRLIDEVKSRATIWEPAGKTTKNGFQSTNNLFFQSRRTACRSGKNHPG